jgi:hypothetical protein
MSRVVNKTDFEIRNSVHTPDFSSIDWVINPASLELLLTGVVPKRYWKVATGPPEDVVEMTGPEKVAVDTGPLLADTRVKQRQALFNGARALIDSRYTAELRQFLDMLFIQAQGAMPNRQTEIKLYMDWLETVMAEVLVRRNTINGAADVPAALAVSLDFSTFAGTDPNITIFSVMTITT